MVNADIVRTPSETCQYVDDADAIRPSGRAVRALRPSGVSFPPFRRRGAHGESLLGIEPPPPGERKFLLEEFSSFGVFQQFVSSATPKLSSAVADP